MKAGIAMRPLRRTIRRILPTRRRCVKSPFFDWAFASSAPRRFRIFCNSSSVKAIEFPASLISCRLLPSAGGTSPCGADGTAPPLLLPLFLQGPEEMARAVDLVLMLADGLGGAVRPAALLGGVPVGQTPGLRFTLQL